MTSNVVDLVKINVLSTGTGSFSLGTNATGYRGVEALTDNQEYGYSVQSGSAWEVGRGTYFLATHTLTRAVVYSSNGGEAVPFGSNAQVAFVALAEDLSALNLSAAAEAAAASAAAASSSASAAAASAAEAAATNALLGGSGGAALVGADDGVTGTLFSTVQGFIAKLLSSAGSSVIGFVQAGTGAVMRALQAKLREVSVSITDYGAAMDGVTDDAPAWNKAIAYLASIGGGVLDIPPGKTLLNSTVVIAASGIGVRGSGSGASWIVNGQTNAPAIKFGDGTSTYYRNSLSSVLFGQKSGVTTVAGNCGLYCVKQSNFVLDNVQVFEYPASLYEGIVWDGVTQSFYNKLGVQGCGYAGVHFKGHCLDIYGSSSRSDGNMSYGFIYYDAEGVYNFGVTAFGNGVNAALIDGSGSDYSINHIHVGCVFDTSGSHNLFIKELQNGHFSKCHFGGAGQSSIATSQTAEGCRLEGAKVIDILFDGCGAAANNGHGLRVEYGAKIKITGGTYGSSKAGTGNGKGESGGSGIYLGAASNRVDVNFANFYANSRYCIEVAAGCTESRAFGCDLRYAALGAILNSANASASNFTAKECPGYNPVGYIATPPVPASGTAITNLSGVDVMVYLAGGTLTGNVEISGHGVLDATNTGYLLPAGGSIKLSYSVAPSWAWNGF